MRVHMSLLCYKRECVGRCGLAGARELAQRTFKAAVMLFLIPCSSNTLSAGASQQKYLEWNAVASEGSATRPGGSAVGNERARAQRGDGAVSRGLLAHPPKGGGAPPERPATMVVFLNQFLDAHDQNQDSILGVHLRMVQRAQGFVLRVCAERRGGTGVQVSRRLAF